MPCRLEDVSAPELPEANIYSSSLLTPQWPQEFLFPFPAPSSAFIITSVLDNSHSDGG